MSTRLASLALACTHLDEVKASDGEDDGSGPRRANIMCVGYWVGVGGALAERAHLKGRSGHPSEVGSCGSLSSSDNPGKKASQVSTKSMASWMKKHERGMSAPLPRMERYLREGVSLCASHQVKGGSSLLRPTHVKADAPQSSKFHSSFSRSRIRSMTWNGEIR